MRVGKTKLESLTKHGVTQDMLKSRFLYDPEAGSLTYLNNQPPFGVRGASATFFNPAIKCYQVSIKGKPFPASRLIWLYTLGELPPCHIVFLDGNSKNLKWENLGRISDNPTHLPTQQELQKLLHYDLLTGNVTWRYAPPYIRRAKVGEKFGCLSRGKSTGPSFKVGSLNGYTKPLTHFIWCYMTGEYPTKGVFLDHKDRNPLNNSWENLRLASPQENNSNQSTRENTKRGLPRGVDKTRNGKFNAKCSFKSKQYNGKPRLTAEEAHQDYIELHKRLHGEFSNYVDEVKT